MSLAICVICYNRIAPLKRVLKSLEAAHYDAPIPLIISIDKSETTAIEDFVEAYHCGYQPIQLPCGLSKWSSVHPFAGRCRCLFHELCTIVGTNLAEKTMANLHDLV